MRIKHLLENIEHTNYLYRGVKEGDPRKKIPDKIIIQPDANKNRIPKDTSRIVHDIINVLTQERLGIKVRNLPFFYNTPNHTGYYGTVYKAPVTDDMTFYYAENVFDLTHDYDSSYYNELDNFDFLGAIAQTGVGKSLTEDNKKLLFKAADVIPGNLYLGSLEINDVHDIEKEFSSIGNKIIGIMKRNGYEGGDEKLIIKSVVDGLKYYFRKFYEYADKIQKTNSYEDIPEKTEVMVDAPKIVLQRLKK